MVFFDDEDKPRQRQPGDPPEHSMANQPPYVSPSEVPSWVPDGAELVIAGAVIGEPGTAGSKRAFPIMENDPANPGKKRPKMKNGRIMTRVDDSAGAKGKAWRGAVHDVVRAMYSSAELIDQPMALEFRVVRVRKGGDYSKRDGGLLPSAPLHPATRPDLTKQLRAFEDALAKVVIREDSRIVAMHTEKVYGDAPERAEFRLWTLPAKAGDLEPAPEGEVEQPALLTA